MSHLIVIGILRNIVPNLVVRQSFDVVVVVVLQDVEDLSTLSEEVILDHSCELNGTKAKDFWYMRSKGPRQASLSSGTEFDWFCALVYSFFIASLITYLGLFIIYFNFKLTFATFSNLTH